MTKVVLLNALKEASVEAAKDLILPVAQQKEDKELPQPRPATVYCMRLPDGKATKKKAPYIIHQSCFLVMPYCDTVCMNRFLEELAKQYSDDQILLCCDGAAWHKARISLYP